MCSDVICVQVRSICLGQEGECPVCDSLGLERVNMTEKVETTSGALLSCVRYIYPNRTFSLGSFVPGTFNQASLVNRREA